MSLNESIFEDAALAWFLLRSAPLDSGGQVGALGTAVGHLPALRSSTRAQAKGVWPCFVSLSALTLTSRF
jgi:hypothetical protein